MECYQNFYSRFTNDQFFYLLPASYRTKADGKLPILSDLARLILARNLIFEGYEKTIWIDANVLIFYLENFNVLNEGGLLFLSGNMDTNQP